MVREAAKVAAASMVVAAFCLVTVAQARDSNGGRTCRYYLDVGEDRTVTSHTGTSGRRFRSRQWPCTRYLFTCDGGHLVISFEETMKCRNGALVVTYDGRNDRVCGPFSSDIVTSGSTLVVSVDSRGGGGFGGGSSSGEHGGKTFFRGHSSGGHGSGGHGSGGHGSGGHGSGGHGSGGHSGSSEEGDDYEFNVLCTTDTTATSTITDTTATSTITTTNTTPTFPITDTTTTSTTTSSTTTT